MRVENFIGGGSFLSLFSRQNAKFAGGALFWAEYIREDFCEGLEKRENPERSITLGKAAGNGLRLAALVADRFSSHFSKKIVDRLDLAGFFLQGVGHAYAAATQIRKIQKGDLTIECKLKAISSGSFALYSGLSVVAHYRKLPGRLQPGHLLSIAITAVVANLVFEKFLQKWGSTINYLNSPDSDDE